MKKVEYFVEYLKELNWTTSTLNVYKGFAKGFEKWRETTGRGDITRIKEDYMQWYNEGLKNANGPNNFKSKAKVVWDYIKMTYPSSNFSEKSVILCEEA